MPTNPTTQLARVVLTKRAVVIQQNAVREVINSRAFTSANQNDR